MFFFEKRFLLLGFLLIPELIDVKWLRSMYIDMRASREFGVCRLRGVQNANLNRVSHYATVDFRTYLCNNIQRAMPHVLCEELFYVDKINFES